MRIAERELRNLGEPGSSVAWVVVFPTCQVGFSVEKPIDLQRFGLTKAMIADKRL